MNIDSATAITQSRYRRISSVYDRMEGIWKSVSARGVKKHGSLYMDHECSKSVLEQEKIDFWPRNICVTAVD